MSNMDFNNAEPQRAGFGGDLIPEGTVALVVMKLRPGNHGDAGWLKINNDQNALMLDVEFTIDGGDFDRRKVWTNMLVEPAPGYTLQPGQETAASISRSALRAVLESARGIEPGDGSEAALERRRVSGYGDFDGLTFCARIGVEGGKLKNKMAGPDSERWPDKNTIKAVTPDDEDYIAPGGASTFKPVGKLAAGVVAAAGAKAAPAAKPAWAQ